MKKRLRKKGIYFVVTDEVTDEKFWEWLKQSGLKEAIEGIIVTT